MYEDKVLVCRDCGKEFTWTAGEQEFFASKGFQNAPVRCRECRGARKANRGTDAPREQVEIVCSRCGKTDYVKFVPRGDAPVYCTECYREMRDQQRY